jgi:hypothetical protein
MPVPFYHEPMSVVHRHFWGVNRLQYPWVPAGESPLRCNISFQRYNETKMAEPAIVIDADVLNGTPCFVARVFHLRISLITSKEAIV